MNKVLNVSAYHFVPLPDAAALRERLLARTQALGLKGTILLAEEGINLFLAGEPDAVRTLLAELRADPRLAGLQAKESWSDTVPFRRMLVKRKREIIRMNHPAIQPAREGHRDLLLTTKVAGKDSGESVSEGGEIALGVQRGLILPGFRTEVLFLFEAAITRPGPD